MIELFSDKSIKPKEKTEQLSDAILIEKISVDDIIAFAEKSKDPVKATCIEALEFASKKNPAVITKTAFEFVTESLCAKAPRVKWESAKVIANSAAQFQKNLDKAIGNLLVNTEHDGTVVRWSAAYALGEIVKLKLKHNKDLIPAIETIIQREEKNSIRKIYLDALQKACATFTTKSLRTPRNTK